MERDSDSSLFGGPALSFLSQTLLGMRPQTTSGTSSGNADSAERERERERERDRTALRMRGFGSSDPIHQLLDMGFPPHWCHQALRATNNNGKHSFI
jgi:hypothetical protein